MATVEEVIVSFEAKMDKFQRDIEQGQFKSQAAFARIEKSSERMGQKIGGAFKFAGAAAAGFVASIGVDTVLRAVSAGLDYASSLGEVAQQLGVTTDALQEYRYAGSQAGLTTEEVDQALGQLTRRIGEGVNGTKAQADAFKKLGISLKDARGNVIETGDAIPLIAEALQRIKSPAEQSAISLDIFGRTGQKLLPLFSDGAKGVNSLRDAAQSLGLVLSSEQIAKADDTADNLDKLKQVLQAKIAGAVSDNAGSILELANALVTLVGSIGGAIKKYKELRETFGASGQLAIGSVLGGVNTDIGRSFIQSGTSRLQQQAAEQRLGGAPRTDLKSLGKSLGPKAKFAAGGNTDLGAPGAGTGVDIKSLQGLLVAELVGPTKKQAVAISAATLEIESRNADLAIALADLSGSLTERAAAEKLRISADAKAEAARIEADDLGLKADRLKLAAKSASTRQAIVDKRLEEDLTAERLSIQRDALDDEARTIAAQADAADTRDERFAFEKRLLDKAYELEKAAILEAAAKGKIADVNVALANLAVRRLADEKKLAEQSASPLDAYRNELSKNAAEINDRFGEIAVRGLRDLNSGLTDAIINGKSLGDALEDSGKRAVAALLDLAFQLIVIRPLLEGLKAATDGDSTTSFISGISKSLGALVGFSSGGYTGSGPSNGVAGVVHKGEYVFDAASTNRIGINNLAAMQRGLLPAGGGGRGGTSVIRIELSGDVDARMLTIAQGASIEVVRAAAPSIVDASVSETFRRGGRPRL